MRYETVYISIDDEVIAAADPWAVIEPVWWSANIYDGPNEYERSLLPFSRSQRLIFAVNWYSAEVNNGGHHQFYSNPTGIVWKDALEAFRSMAISELVGILEQSAERLGGLPSLYRQERSQQLDSFDPDFDDLDELFYEAQGRVNLNHQMSSFIHSRPSDFYFEGMVKRGVLPSR